MNVLYILGKLFHYTPGRDREVLHKLEMDFMLPPKSTVRLSFMVEKRHLRVSCSIVKSQSALSNLYIFKLCFKWDEYPPDANHGFYLESSHFEVNYTYPDNPDSPIKTCYYSSRKLLVNLSTPDFSMPYNVICLTCTVVALAFGPLHNITTKELKLTPKDNKDKITQKLLAALKRFWKKVRGRKSEVEPIPSTGEESIETETEAPPPQIETPQRDPEGKDSSSTTQKLKSGDGSGRKRKAKPI